MNNNTNNITMYDPKREYNTYKNEIDTAINNVLNHGIFINGPEVKELENKLANYTKSKHCIAVSNGTDALKIALLALGVKHGDEVITVAHSWISTAEIIPLIGATPVFIDIEMDTYNMDPLKLEQAITDKTKAIIVVSLYGMIGDIEGINMIAEKYNIPVIEDGAQSFGAERKGKKSCNTSLIGTTSFFPSKPLGCYGDGGACFTNDDNLANIMRAIRAHGGLKRFEHEYIGMNARLDTIQAAILLAKFNHFEETIQNRNKCANYYSEKLKDVKEFILPKTPIDNISAWAQYSILAPNKEIRDNIVSYMNKNGVILSVFYPVPLYKQKCFNNIAITHDMKNTDMVCDRVFNLPCYGEITTEEMDYIVKHINQFALNFFH